MFILKKLLSALILPPMGFLLLGFLGLWLERGYRRLGKGLVAVSLLGIFLLSFFPVANWLQRGLAIYPPISEVDLMRVQAIVILGAGIYRDAPEYGGDTVSRASLERIRYGNFLQQRSNLPILVSGGSPFGGKPEGETMRDALEKEFRGKVKWIENKSRDTAESATYTGHILRREEISRIALVSNSAHLRRATRYFEDQGLEVFSAPTGFATDVPSASVELVPSIYALVRSTEAISEWLGIFVQILTHEFRREK